MAAPPTTAAAQPEAKKIAMINNASQLFRMIIKPPFQEKSGIEVFASSQLFPSAT
jgi:hypothetical protein